MSLTSLGEEATYAVVSLISDALLENFDRQDLAVAIAAFAIYYLVRVAGLDSKLQDNQTTHVLTKSWQLFGYLIVGIITNYIIQEVEATIGFQGITVESIILGFSLVIVALVIQEFGLLEEPRLVGIVVFSLGTYYSELLLFNIESNKGYLTDPVVVLTLFGSYVWLHYYQRLHQLLFDDNSYPYLERVFTVVTRTAKFILVRWVVNVYEQFVFSDMYHPILWLPHLGGIAAIAIFIEGFDRQDAKTIKSTIEYFAFFLSIVIFDRYTSRFLPDVLFVTFWIIVWYIFKSILALDFLQNNTGFWWRWIRYTLGLTSRVASYLAIQAVLPHLSTSISHSTNTIERLGIFFQFILVASSLLWNGI